MNEGEGKTYNNNENNNNRDQTYGTALNSFRHGTNTMFRRRFPNGYKTTRTVRAAADYLVERDASAYVYKNFFILFFFFSKMFSYA